MRIGLYGGTFNPVHQGHLLVAQTAFDALGLDEVVFIPAGEPPLKGNHQLVDGEHRLAMLNAAVADNPNFSVSDFEIRRPGRSFTIDTVRHFAHTSPAGTELFFILGDDCTAKLDRWKGIDELRQLVRFVNVDRLASSPDTPDGDVLSLKMPTFGISSTLLRERLARKQSIRYLAPTPVIDYIRRHSLYELNEPTASEILPHA